MILRCLWDISADVSSRQRCVFRALEGALGWSEIVTATGEDAITRDNMWSQKKAEARTQGGLLMYKDR